MNRNVDMCEEDWQGPYQIESKKGIGCIFAVVMRKLNQNSVAQIHIQPNKTDGTNQVKK